MDELPPLKVIVNKMPINDLFNGDTATWVRVRFININTSILILYLCFKAEIAGCTNEVRLQGAKKMNHLQYPLGGEQKYVSGL